MEVTTTTEITAGTAVRIAATIRDADGALTDPSELALLVRDPGGVETDMTPHVVHDSQGKYHLDLRGDTPGDWYWKLSTELPTTVAADSFTIVDPYVEAPDPQHPTDLRVLVPRARRYCEGPYGPAPGRQSLSEQQLYEMVADGFSDIIMFAAGLFPRQIEVTQRDARVGFPIAWASDSVLEEWEASIIVTQVALNYWYFSLRDMRTSVTINNEGSEYSYTTSANIIRDYIKSLQSARDTAVETLMSRFPVVDRFVSNLRVRDYQTVALLEWWDTSSPPGEFGLGGSQGVSVVPWSPGDFGTHMP